MQNKFKWQFIRILVVLWPVIGMAFSGSPSIIVNAGTLTGVVTNVLTGQGIIGAKIQVNGQTTYSIASGVYSLTVDPPGTYLVNCLKTGFDDFVSAPVTIQQGSTTILNIQLAESANAPEGATAVLDTSAPAVHLSWSRPVGSYELLYDDGIQDQFTVWATQGNMNGVRYTPPAYPAGVKGGSVNLGSLSNYPAGSNPLVPFQVAVFNATGPSGMPGTIIGGPFDILPSHLGWVDFTFPSPVEILSGSFYLVMIQGGDYPNAAGLAVDGTHPQFRSVQRFLAGGGIWTPASGNFMIRALLDGPGGPVDLTENGDALLGYQVWRLRQGEEQNPSVWVNLGPTVNLSLDDPGWPAFPCGPYLWGIKAEYTGNRWSPVTYSNILGKCWTAKVTIQTDLTCVSGNKSGTGIQLVNLVYPDTTYNATTDSTGTVVIPHVWKGTYNVHINKFGYQPQVQSLSVSRDTVFSVLLLQEKPMPRELEVGNKTLIAHWKIPEYKKELFFEDWSSAGFTLNGWTTSGGNNWIISTVNGNPTPAVMFGWSPQVFDYHEMLTSRQIETEYAPVLLLRYDIVLDNFGTTTMNQMAVEVWDGTAWEAVASYSNSTGSFPWTSEVLDISAWSGHPLRVRFHASGGDSYDINGWYVDNVSVEGSETQSGLLNCVLGYNVYLDNILSGFTSDTKYPIPGDQVQYGQTYNVCANAVYGSGWSGQTCVLFTSGFLWPPSHLMAEVIENSVALTWDKPEMPDTLGQMVSPPGLLGYHIFRNSILIDSILSPDILEYYDLQMEPGTYSYTLTAWYDLTEYGFPGQFDDSAPEGPATVQINWGRPLPFFEPWAHASFSFNDWQFVPGQGNWSIITSDGNPMPSAEFAGDPQLTDYKYALVSPPLDGSPYHCGTIRIDFDLALETIHATGSEMLTLALFYDNAWHNIADFQNDSSLAWSHFSYDISEVSGKGFMVGFDIGGSISSDILYWRLDNIYIYSTCFGPRNLQADAQGTDVYLAWQPPDCSGSNMYLNEGFEGELFPPESWSQSITDPSATWSQMNALSPVGVHSGDYAAGLLWDYVHQDEWLVAENVIVNGNLQFWSYAFQGSVHQDHYFVKISQDEGLTWTVLFDLTALPSYNGPGGYNQWMEPYTVDLSAYQGEVVSLAWHAIDGDGQGLWYAWAIDDCTIGTKKLHPVSPGGLGSKSTAGIPDNLLGYDIFRRNPGALEFARININLLSDTFYMDPGLSPGQYEYFCHAVFSECTQSENSDTTAVDVITGISGAKNDPLSVYPVPATDHLCLESSELILSIQVFNVNGVKMTYSELFNKKVTMDVSRFPPGNYLFRIITVSGCYNRMVIVF